MSSIYENNINKHSNLIQKIIEDSNFMNDKNFTQMINELSNSVIDDIDNLKTMIRKNENSGTICSEVNTIDKQEKKNCSGINNTHYFSVTKFYIELNCDETKDSINYNSEININNIVEKLNFELNEYKNENIKLNETIENLKSELSNLEEKFKRTYKNKCNELDSVERKFEEIMEKFFLIFEKKREYQNIIIEDNNKLKNLINSIFKSYNDKEFDNLNFIFKCFNENENINDKIEFDINSLDSVINFNYDLDNPKIISTQSSLKQIDYKDLNLNKKNKSTKSIKTNSKNNSFIFQENNDSLLCHKNSYAMIHKRKNTYDEKI